LIARCFRSSSNGRTRNPLVATFGGISFERIPDGMGVVDFPFEATWHRQTNKRSEVVQRLLAAKCELCGIKDEPVQVPHIRKLADIDRPGRRPKDGLGKDHVGEKTEDTGGLRGLS